MTQEETMLKFYSVSFSYNDINLCITSAASDILWYQLILTVNHNIILLG